MSPDFEEILEAKGLPADEEELVRRYARDGYLVLDDLGLGDFDAVTERILADVEPLHDGGAYNRIRDAWTVSEEVHRLATADRILHILRTLYERRPIPFQTLNFWRGSQQATHSDAWHFHCFPRHMMCGVWVALEDTDERNGALHYYPGSHLLREVESVDLAARENLEASYTAYVRQVIEAHELEKARPALN